MILVERRQPNHNNGASGPFSRAARQSPRSGLERRQGHTSLLLLYAAARSRCQRRSRIQQISASFRATATRAMGRLERFRTRS